LVATGLVPPPIPGYRRDACGPRCSRDLGRARALVSTLSGDELTLDFSDSAVGQQLASALASQLDEVGLSVRPRPHDDESFATLIRDGRQELFCFVWVGDYPRQQAFLEPLLRSDSPDNHTRLEDARIDRILERARAEPDPTAREERYRQVERLALQRAPLFPIAWFRSRLAVQDYVGGFVLDPLGGFDVSHLSIGR